MDEHGHRNRITGTVAHERSSTMFRHLILPTLVAILLIPDWASAFFRRKPTVCPPVVAQKVQYPVPVYVAPPCPPMFLAPPVCCPPAAVAPAPDTTKPAAPQVVPERMAPPKAVAPDTTKGDPSKPLDQPKPEKPVEPKLPSVVPSPDTKRSPAPAAPMEPIKPVTSEEKLPPVSVPLNPPAPAPMLPKLSLPETTPPPTPNPTPAKDSNPIEVKPTPVAPEKALPKLELPNLDLPSAPPLAVPKEVEVKSSPIAAEKTPVAIELFPKDGAVPGDPSEKRIVTFHNFSGRDLILTIDGKSYTLPAKHTVEGKLNPQFTLRVGLGEEQDVKLPASAPGAEIVLKK
jgi:hypothetical protein